MRTAGAFTGDAPPAATDKARLGCEIAVAYLRARLALRRGGIRGALGAVRAVPQSRAAAKAADPVVAGRRLGHAVARTLAILPSDSRCLMRSLVLTALLSRRGIESRLVIAVRPGGEFAAHAWVEHAGIALLPTEGPAFEQLVTL